MRMLLTAKARHNYDVDSSRGLISRRLAVALVIFFLSFVLQGCGGGGSSGTQPPPPPAFSLTATPSAPSIVPGTSSTLQVSVYPSNGFSGSVSVTISGLPAGLSASPSSFTLQSTPQSVTLIAAASMATGTYPFQFNGTSGALNGSATVKVGVGPLQTFVVVQPTVLEVVARFGSATPVPVQTEVCCPPGPDNYQVNFSE